MIFVLDSSAVLAYLRSEPGEFVVEELLSDENNNCYILAINLCEVYYDVVREYGKQRALATIRALEEAGLILREDMDFEFWQSVGDHKAPGGISLADCFCMVLANRLDAELVTADRQEFGPAAEQRLCRVRFVR